MEGIMDTKQLYVLIEEFFEYKVNMLYLNTEEKEVKCILYDSFFLKCDINDRYGRFGAGLCFGDIQENTLTRFLGKSCSLNSDEQSIRESLNIIDEYCRLRLPDKFLEAHYKAYVLDQYEDYDL